MADLRPVDGGRRGVKPEHRRDIDLESEAALAGGLLYDATGLDVVRGIVRPEHFHTEPYRRVYEAACELREAGLAVDIVSVASHLREHGRLEQVGGTAALMELSNAVPALGETILRQRADRVLSAWARRQLWAHADRMRAQALDTPVSPEEILIETRARMDAIADTLGAAEPSTDAKSVVDRSVKLMETASSTEGRGSRPTGFDRLDRMTAGLHSELVLLAGRPGMGKTALACAIALNRASAGEGAFIASIETIDTTLMTRILCAEARIALHGARTGALSEKDWQKLTAAAAHVHSLPLWLDDTAMLTATELWAKARRKQIALERESKKLGIVVVDYLQLLRPPRAGMKREEVVSENARALKAMATELDCPVLALCQVNRECEKRGKDKRPQLSDLRESGELEQCARTVMLLYRDEYYHRDTVDKGIAEVNIAKQNNGPTGEVRLHFAGYCTRFDNLAEGEFADDEDPQ